MERQKERSLPSPRFKFTQPSQMAVFSCMRLEDVSDSRCRFLGKLIFQAKILLFLYFCFGGALRLGASECFRFRFFFLSFNEASPLHLRGKDGCS